MDTDWYGHSYLERWRIEYDLLGLETAPRTERSTPSGTSAANQSRERQAESGQLDGLVAELEFRRGYQDFNGNPQWEDHFIDVILLCENEKYGWVWNPEASQFISVAQFYLGSWATVSNATGLNNPYDLYHVGANVAWWGNNIEHPGGAGGWPVCWWI